MPQPDSSIVRLSDVETDARFSAANDDHSTIPSGYSRRLYNDDLGPVKQKWGAYNICAFWMSDIHSVGGYVVAASLFSLGLAGWQVMLSLLVGILVVQCFANLLAKPSQQAAVPYPVICRISFGVFGANIPALVRGCIALVWFGIQTYLASNALIIVLLRVFPSLAFLEHMHFLGLSAIGWVGFMALWCFQVLVFIKGMESVRSFIDWAGPLVYLAMFILAGWLVIEAGPHNLHFSLSNKVLSPAMQGWEMIAATALVVGYFAGPTLSFGDFSRYCRSMKAIRRGNWWGLPINFLLFSATTVVMVSATLPVFGKMITDPIQTVAQLNDTTVALMGALTFMLTTMGINIVANFVSPAFDFSNVAPRWVSFRTGGFITALGAILVMPWKLFNSPELIQYTVGILGAVIGPIYGIILTDYYRVKRQQIDIDSLYRRGPAGQYWYRNGINPKALQALVPAIIVALAMTLIPLDLVHDFAIFGGGATAALVYWLLNRRHS